MVSREALQDVLYEIIVKDNDLFMTTIPEGCDAEIMGNAMFHPRYEPPFSHIVMIVHYVVQTFEGVNLQSQIDLARIYDRLKRDRDLLKTCVAILVKYRAKAQRSPDIDNYLNCIKVFLETAM
jgi:hypothetical protein